jgi:phosphate ABC transporter permease protein PstC
MATSTAPTTRRPERSFARSGLQRLPDRALTAILFACGGAVLVILAFFFVRILVETWGFWSGVGIVNFALGGRWYPAGGFYGAFPMVYGTLVTSVIAVVIGVPVAVASALYVSELAPRRVAAPLSMAIELLAAVPSVVFGLWGVFVLIPGLRPVEAWVAGTFGFIPIFDSDVPGPNYFIAGLILAIMIVPIITAISREVMATVPSDHREAALALGATRWEMIKLAVLPYSRPGIVGATMLGLGRALGETIAVVLVIGNAPRVAQSIFDQGYTLAAVIANEFGEAASDPRHRNALIAAGLLLFIITLVVNIIARYFVVRADRGSGRGQAVAGMAGGGMG